MSWQFWVIAAYAAINLAWCFYLAGQGRSIEVTVGGALATTAWYLFVLYVVAAS